MLPRAGFVAQEHPLHKRFSLAEMIEYGSRLNPPSTKAWRNEGCDGSASRPTTRSAGSPAASRRRSG
jgi:hypothetical protein